MRYDYARKLRPSPMKLKTIHPQALIPMDIFEEKGRLRVDLAYAGSDSFCGAIYRKNARLWLHEDLATIVVLASGLCQKRHGSGLVIYDGLRTVSAQEKMGQCAAVKAHPHWLEGPDRVISSPGMGGHPRAMAIDVTIEDAEMGTAFDQFPEGGAGPETNRAHRAYMNLPEAIKQNRKNLEACMMDAARILGLTLIPLSVEWWDFRFPAEYTNQYAPLDEIDLPAQMRMTDTNTAASIADFSDTHFQMKKAEILSRIKTQNL